MSVLITHNPSPGICSAFGETLEQAKENAEQLMASIKETGSFAKLDDRGHLLKPGLYGWNVIIQQIEYS